MAAESRLRVWSITADGTSMNLNTFRVLGCEFRTIYESMVTKFQHSTRDFDVFVILDLCHMLKLTLSSFADSKGEKVRRMYFQNLHTLQEKQGLKLGNRLSNSHLQFEKHKMNVTLAA